LCLGFSNYHFLTVRPCLTVRLGWVIVAGWGQYKGLTGLYNAWYNINMKRIIYITLVLVFAFSVNVQNAFAYVPNSQWVNNYYNNTVHNDGVYYGQSNKSRYIRTYGNQQVIYQEYPVYYDVPVYYPVYQKPAPRKPVCNDNRRGAHYYENSDQGPRCNDRIEDWNNRQGLPNEFLSSMYGSENY